VWNVPAAKAASAPLEVGKDASITRVQGVGKTSAVDRALAQSAPDTI
jgi:hypothetical protein